VSTEYAGYLYAHIKREDEDGEQVYFALSEGNDPLRFADLNGGRPVLRSVLGEGGVRDPHIVRSPEGDRFYLVATDLCLYKSLDWDRHQRHGSRSIMVWESADLVDWGEGRLVEVAPPEAGDTWAPEAVWDPEQDAYLVHWSSTLLTAADWKPLAEGIGLGAIGQGEGPLVYKSNTEDKWFLWIDEFTRERRYGPFETTDLAAGEWSPAAGSRLPDDPCHGVVLPVTAAEYERLAAAWR
jgi:hypothetical protein